MKQQISYIELLQHLNSYHQATLSGTTEVIVQLEYFEFDSCIVLWFACIGFELVSCAMLFLIPHSGDNRWDDMSATVFDLSTDWFQYCAISLQCTQYNFFFVSRVGSLYCICHMKLGFYYIQMSMCCMHQLSRKGLKHGQKTEYLAWLQLHSSG